MTVLYLDTNALAKLFAEDAVGAGGEREKVLDAVRDTPRVVTSAITYAEVRGVFARKWQEGSLSEEDHAATVRDFNESWERLNVVDVTQDVSGLAGDLLAAHRARRLRGMDALHLASALTVRREVPLRFLTFDGDLAAVARALMPGDAL